MTTELDRVAEAIERAQQYFEAMFQCGLNVEWAQVGQIVGQALFRAHMEQRDALSAALARFRADDWDRCGWCGVFVQTEKMQEHEQECDNARQERAMDDRRRLEAIEENERWHKENP